MKRTEIVVLAMILTTCFKLVSSDSELISDLYRQKEEALNKHDIWKFLNLYQAIPQNAAGAIWGFQTLSDYQALINHLRELGINPAEYEASWKDGVTVTFSASKIDSQEMKKNNDAHYLSQDGTLIAIINNKALFVPDKTSLLSQNDGNFSKSFPFLFGMNIRYVQKCLDLFSAKTVEDVKNDFRIALDSRPVSLQPSNSSGEYFLEIERQIQTIDSSTANAFISRSYSAFWVSLKYEQNGTLCRVHMKKIEDIDFFPKLQDGHFTLHVDDNGNVDFAGGDEYLPGELFFLIYGSLPNKPVYLYQIWKEKSNEPELSMYYKLAYLGYYDQKKYAAVEGHASSYNKESNTFKLINSKSIFNLTDGIWISGSGVLDSSNSEKIVKIVIDIRRKK